MCALGGTFLLFFGVALRVALRAREVQVPVLVGKTVNDASQSLATLGLTLKIEPVRRTDPQVPQNRIVQQDPAGGVAAAGAAIDPRLDQRGTTHDDSTGAGRADGAHGAPPHGTGWCRARFMTEFRSPDYPADAVVSQDPPPAAKAPSVALLLNRGEQSTTYVMPDVIGTDGAHVADALRARGFRVTIVGSQPYPGVPPGTVVRQQPARRLSRGRADPISLEVSR